MKMEQKALERSIQKGKQVKLNSEAAYND